MKKSGLAVPILVGLVLAACGGRVASPPLIKLAAGGTLVDGVQGGYCWEESRSSTICVDPIEPQFGSPVALPAGGPINLQLDSPLPDTVTLALSREVFGETVVSESAVVAETLAWSPQVEEGAYILHANATWPQGAVTTRFSVQLGSAAPIPPDPPDPPAVPSSPPLISLLHGDDALYPGIAGPSCWDDGSGAALCVDPAPPTFELTDLVPQLHTDPIRLRLEEPLPDTLTLSLVSTGIGEATAAESVPVAEVVEWAHGQLPGTYNLTAAAKWSQGDASFIFPVSLELQQDGGEVASPPLIRLNNNGAMVEGWGSSYCWTTNGVEQCVDSGGPAPIDYDFEPLTQLPAAGPIRLQLDEPLPTSLELSLTESVNSGALASETLTPATTVDWSPQIAPGTYILWVGAVWPQGDRSHVFAVQLGTPVVTQSHTVQRGERLYSISRQTGTSVNDLISLNAGAYPSLRANPHLIHPGWVLTTSGAPAPPAPRTHTVQRGQRLYRIALDYGTSVEALIGANAGQYPGLSSNPALIQPGWVLTIPA